MVSEDTPVFNNPDFQRTLRQNTPHNALNTIPVTNLPRGNIPNTPLASSTISFFLGGVFAFGLYTSIIDTSSVLLLSYQLGLFLASWAFFHWAEFAVTAGWNLEKCSIDSYLLDNGALYHISNGIAILEHLLTLYLKPASKSWPYVSQLGIIFIVVGQILRSTAMIHASTNFSHTVARHKREAHCLVTNGVYAWSRHPSYAGFFYWALGTQLLLQNPLTFTLFLIILWRFFYFRTRDEEALLIRFFGKDYVEYKRRVGTKIPFIP